MGSFHRAGTYVLLWEVKRPPPRSVLLYHVFSAECPPNQMEINEPPPPLIQSPIPCGYVCMYLHLPTLPTYIHRSMTTSHVPFAHQRPPQSPRPSRPCVPSHLTQSHTWRHNRDEYGIRPAPSPTLCHAYHPPHASRGYHTILTAVTRFLRPSIARFSKPPRLLSLPELSTLLTHEPGRVPIALDVASAANTSAQG